VGGWVGCICSAWDWSACGWAVCCRAPLAADASRAPASWCCGFHAKCSTCSKQRWSIQRSAASFWSVWMLCRVLRADGDCCLTCMTRCLEGCACAVTSHCRWEMQMQLYQLVMNLWKDIPTDGAVPPFHSS